MASTHTPSHILPVSESKKKEKMLEDIKLRVAEVRRRIEMMDREDDEINRLIERVSHLSNSAKD